jgi:EpsD family peptidyl-prolyl cis-trans isomerase
MCAHLVAHFNQGSQGREIMRGSDMQSGQLNNRMAISKAALMLLAVMTISACGNKEKPAGQSMARVNGEEITVHQLNAELERVNPQVASKKQVLDGLIARQLLIEEAEKNKMDRDPKIMQSIERSKEQILAQAYLQSRIGNVPKPSEAEIQAFYEKNPQMFAQRKQFDTKELIIETKDLTPELVSKMNNARTLQEVQEWLQAHQVKFVPTQATRTSVELPAEVVDALSKMAPGSLFTVKQGDRSQLILLTDVRSSPLTLDVARPKIQEFLMLQKSKDAADAEIARLRAAAKVEYLNQSAELQDKPAATPAVAESDTKANAPISDVERGIGNLK